MNAPNFNYEPLQDPSRSLRLVEILPPSSDSHVRLRLRQAPTQSEYSCLSYVWGDTTEEREILLDDQIFRVRRNLFNFLHTAQQRYTGQSFWIDALCINQTDAQERNRQVQRMADIYSQAETVLVWLGLQNKQDMDYLVSIFDFITNDSEKIFQKLSQDRWQEWEQWERAVQCLCRNRYWSRTWITQEILLARRVIVSTDTMSPWTHLSRGLKYSFQLGINAPSDRSNVRSYSQWCLAKGSLQRNASPFWVVFYSLRHSESEDRRDRIYGLLALVERGQGFRVDYTESVPSLFWRAGTFFGAWAQMKCVWMLFQALGLTVDELKGGMNLSETGAAMITVRSICKAYKPRNGWTTLNEHGVEPRSLLPNSICCERCCCSFPIRGANDTLYCVWLIAAQTRTHLVVSNDNSKCTVNFYPHSESDSPKVIRSLGQCEIESSPVEQSSASTHRGQDLIRPGFTMRLPTERMMEKIEQMEERQNHKRKAKVGS